MNNQKWKVLRIETEEMFQQQKHYFRVISSTENKLPATVCEIPFGRWRDEEEARKIANIIVEAPRLLECVSMCMDYLEKNNMKDSIIYKTMEPVYKKATE